MLKFKSFYFAVALFFAPMGVSYAGPVGPSNIIIAEFDLSGATPEPPYTRVGIQVWFDETFDLGEGFTFQVFDSTNTAVSDPMTYSSPFDFTGVGTFSTGLDLLPVGSYNFDLYDGLGYFLFTDIVGTFNVNQVDVRGIIQISSTYSNYTPLIQTSISISTVPVPEPSFTFLLAMGLGAVCLVGWSFKQNRSKRPNPLI